MLFKHFPPGSLWKTGRHKANSGIVSVLRLDPNQIELKFLKKQVFQIFFLFYTRGYLLKVVPLKYQWKNRIFELCKKIGKYEQSIFSVWTFWQALEHRYGKRTINYRIFSILLLSLNGRISELRWSWTKNLGTMSIYSSRNVDFCCRLSSNSSGAPSYSRLKLVEFSKNPSAPPQ